MPKPNYQFERRRRDLEKKAKKEAKRQRKLESDSRLPDENSGAQPPSTSVSATA